MSKKYFSLLPGLCLGLCFTFGFIYYIYAVSDLRLSEFNAAASALLVSLLSYLLYMGTQWTCGKVVARYCKQPIVEAIGTDTPQQEPVPIPQDNEQRRIERMNAKHELHQRKLACAISHLEEFLIANMNKEDYTILVDDIKLFVDEERTAIPEPEHPLKVRELKQGDMKHLLYNVAYIFGINNLDTAVFIKNHFPTMFPDSEPESIKKKLTSKSANDIVPIRKDLFQE
jgi:hypothetical protein